MKTFFAHGIVVWIGCSSLVLGQTNTHDLGQLQQLQQQQQAANNAAQGRAKRAAGIQQRRLNMALREHHAFVTQLDASVLKQWQKKKGPRGDYYQFDIERRGQPVFVALYSPKWGYVVDGKNQDNGLPWKTLDQALAARFSNDELWLLPDIPGWAKSHLLTGPEHVAEMKRDVLARAKPAAVRKMADGVAYEIADKLGPQITEDISNELGLRQQPPQKQNGNRLTFQPVHETNEKVYFEDQDARFLIYQYKNGMGYEVFEQVPGGEPKKISPLIATLDEAIAFASNQP